MAPDDACARGHGAVPGEHLCGDAAGALSAPPTIAKKLALDQREAAALFGGGANAFSRYETGKNQPPRSLIQLLSVLERHPSLLDEIRAATPSG
ncbi:MAG: type II toxin-antitoxin system MqsA family antitoxin [Mitsuaria chitosanitabida]|nr:type II toxin-antitoxin system MqsA family antitoxin [Roseateles chitosanitabidus]